ncbi:hypothetical protein HDU97_001976 [Phlyctochytrium planicorne]|nr:hypothetical protein HDU97_001976 [Phlyctochytrium planicorne]
MKTLNKGILLLAIILAVALGIVDAGNFPSRPKPKEPKEKTIDLSSFRRGGSGTGNNGGVEFFTSPAGQKVAVKHLSSFGKFADRGNPKNAIAAYKKAGLFLGLDTTKTKLVMPLIDGVEAKVMFEGTMPASFKTSHLLDEVKRAVTSVGFFHPDITNLKNIIVEPGTGRLKAVIDWDDDTQK